MNQTCECLNEFARRRLLSTRGEPLFIADWERVLMIHFEIERAALQAEVPFELDLRGGRAFVSLVAFTLRGMRPRFGGKVGALLFRPIATHEFLNVRTYVKRDGECGIFFLAEWLSNRLSVALGPRIFGLPYRLGDLRYDHEFEKRELSGQVMDPCGGGVLTYAGKLDPMQSYSSCEEGSLTEWLMERYTAFTNRNRELGLFRVWHAPWSQVGVSVDILERSLLETNWRFFREASFIGAHFSRGLQDVWMGRRHRCG